MATSGTGSSTLRLAVAPAVAAVARGSLNGSSSDSDQPVEGDNVQFR